MHRFDTEDYTLNVTTRYSPEMIEQEVHNSRETLVRNVVHLQDEGIKEALAKLGWLPPEEQVAEVNIERGTPLIVSAANKLSDGTLLIGARHWDELMAQQLRVWLKAKGMTEEDWISRTGRLEEEQGFIDQRGNFYSRKAAWGVAQTNNQIRFTGPGYEGPDLYSENLY